MAPRGRKSQGSNRGVKTQAEDPIALQPTSLLSTLPEELWHEIFRHCLSTDEFIRPTRTSAPLLLCQVCSTWRTYAISASDLWASISIGSQFDDLGCLPRVELVELWLSRAKGRPLSISYGRYPLGNEFAGLWEEYYPDEEEVYEVFGILVRHIALWKSLRLCPMEIVKGSLPPIPESGAPILQSLCLFLPPSFRSPEYDFSRPDQSIYDIWSNSPLLDAFSFLSEDISIDGSSDSLFTSAHLQWRQLTTLTITASQTIAECLQFLKECPNLVDCAFHSIFAGNNNILSVVYPRPILLASLKSFFLRVSGPVRSNLFADLLLKDTTMPALRQLTLESVFVLSTYTFEAFTHRSSCHLEELTLYGVDMNDTCLIQILELHSQSLVRLCIRHYGPGPMSDTVMHRLTRDESTPSSARTILCPKLESINLDYCVVRARDGLFSKMVSSRFGVEEYGITALKRVVLRFGDEAAMARSLDVRMLKDLRQWGVIGVLNVEKIDRWH